VKNNVSRVSGSEANREKQKEQDKWLDNRLKLRLLKVHFILEFTYFSSLAIFS